MILINFLNKKHQYDQVEAKNYTGTGHEIFSVRDFTGDK